MQESHMARLPFCLKLWRQTLSNLLSHGQEMILWYFEKIYGNRTCQDFLFPLRPYVAPKIESPPFLPSGGWVIRFHISRSGDIDVILTGNRAGPKLFPCNFTSKFYNIKNNALKFHMKILSILMGVGGEMCRTRNIKQSKTQENPVLTQNTTSSLLFSNCTLPQY